MRDGCAAGLTGEKPMRVLWVGKKPTDGGAGDEIFDRKTIAALRASGHSVDRFHPSPVERPRAVMNLIAGLPHYRTRFTSESNRSAIRRLHQGYDMTVCSWEPFDALCRGLSPPCTLILHNVTSRSLPAIFPESRLAGLAALRARKWERQCYRPENFATVAALSRRDLAYLRTLDNAPDLLLLPPGMPACITLAHDAVLVNELVISGTFDWTPKRRDILAFARDYEAVADRVMIRADGLPAEAMQRLRPLPTPSAMDNASALRFGLIADRFEAGHKLKTMAYIAANQIVLSFADIGFDFAHIPDHAFFIRKIDTVAEIAAHAAALSSVPAALLRARFLAFQQACAQSFTWDAVAATLLRNAIGKERTTAAIAGDRAA
jgi:hypothetical protein